MSFLYAGLHTSVAADIVDARREAGRRLRLLATTLERAHPDMDVWPARRAAAEACAKLSRLLLPGSSRGQAAAQRDQLSRSKHLTAAECGEWASMWEDG